MVSPFLFAEYTMYIMRGGKMAKDLEERFEDYFKRREQHDKKWWEGSLKLEDEFDALMKELDES